MYYFRQGFALVIAASLVQTAPTTTDRLDGFLRAQVARGDIPGVVAMVVDRQATIYSGAFGKADDARNRPMAKDSIFRIASMTKPVTSLAAMMLVEQGQLGLDDPVTKYLPEYANLRVLTTWRDDGTYDARPPRRPITLRDLLTHTSGLAYGFVDARINKLEEAKTKQVDLPLVSDPGERFAYGPSTMVVGEIIAKVSHLSLDAFFEQRIFEPLGMHDTFFTVPAAKRERVVTLHMRADHALREAPNPPTLTAPARGDGGLFSTAADYARFMQLFLNRGRVGTSHLVSERTIDLMTSNQLGKLTIGEQPTADASLSKPFPIGAGKDTFGFGFQIEARPATPGLRSAGSLSWGGIFNTHFWIDPARSVAAVVLMQVLPYYDPSAMAVVRGFEVEVYRAKE
jgi:CubicO group peptidase (beta-lactamase class C family)